MSKSEQPAQVGSTDGLGPFPWGDDIDAWLEVSDAAQVAADIRAFVAQEVAAERKRWARVRELAFRCAEWHIGDGDECGEIARELYELLRPNVGNERPGTGPLD